MHSSLPTAANSKKKIMTIGSHNSSTISSSSFPSLSLFLFSLDSETLHHPGPNSLYFLLPLISLVLFLFVSISLVLESIIPFHEKKSPLPPGPFPWPLVGNLPELMTKKSAFRWILGHMEELNVEIACIKFGNVHVVPVTSPEIAREFLKKHDTVFASRPLTMASDHLTKGFLTTALSPWGEQWKKMKRIIVSEVIKPAKQTWFLQKRTEEADNLVRFVYNQCKFMDSSMVNLRHASRHYTGNVARKMILSKRYFGEGRKDGGPGPEEEQHVDALFTSLAYLFAFSPIDYLPRLRALDLDGHQKIIKEVCGIINKHHDPIVDERMMQWRNGEKKEVEDILDVFITIRDTKGKPMLSVEEIKAQIIELMMAMVDNPAHATEWAMAEMINQPEIMQKAMEEIDKVVGRERLVEESDIPKLNYVKACAREALRLHPIAPFNIPHVSIEDAVVAGYFIPKGSHVLLSRVGLGRNPRVWDEPLKFKPERHMNDNEVDLAEHELRFISFSTGRRGCPGIALGTAMTVMLLARLLQGFSWSPAPDQDKIDLKESVNDLFLATPLHAAAKPRLHASLYGN